MLPLSAPRKFTNPGDHLDGLTPDAVGRIVSSASDISVVVDAEGGVEDISYGSDDLAQEGLDGWVGQSFESCVTIESRDKLARLFAGIGKTDDPRGIHLNHPSPMGPDLPVSYAAAPLDRGRVLLVGTDLRPMAVLQRRLVTAQQMIERDHSHLRHVETRYQLLMQGAHDAVLMLDAESGRITEANATAERLFGLEAATLTQLSFPTGLDPESTGAVRAMLTNLRRTGRTERLLVRRADHGDALEISAQIFRTDRATQIMLRIATSGGTMPAGDGDHEPNTEQQILRLVRQATEGIVLTGTDGRLVWANDAFLDMTQAALPSQVLGVPLESFFARRGADLTVIMQNAREHGRLRLFASTINGVLGTTTETEISAVALSAPHGEAWYGFVIRNVSVRPPVDPVRMPRSMDQLTELIGRVPLKELVRESTDVLEKLCIEAALEITGNNRAAAAELLGLSRQSLYVKLRRYGLSDSENGD